MTDQYITVKTRGADEFTVSKSRFIGYACPCASENDAVSFIREIREMHRDAKHHCYAYIIGQNSGIMRYSDDGEPGGTAGLPILEVMRSQQIVNCSVVVVRYFGGILLGTGGLVRAYTQGCKIALQAAAVVRMEKTLHYLCDVPYSVWDSFLHAAESLPVHVLNPEFAMSVSFTLAVRTQDAESILDKLSSVTSRKLDYIQSDESFEPWEV